MADETPSTETTAETKKEPSTETTVDTIPKKDYETLSGNFNRLQTLNQDLVKEGEATKQQVAELKEKLATFESANKTSKLKNAKTPEEIQALLDEQVNGVTAQFSGKLDEANKTIETQAAQLKELMLSDKLNELMTGRVKKDCQSIIKQKALSELKIDPANPTRMIVIDANGLNVPSKVNAGQPMDAAEWMQENESVHPSLFEPKGAHGGSLNNGEQRSKVSTSGLSREQWMKVRGTLSQEERHKGDIEHGF